MFFLCVGLLLYEFHDKYDADDDERQWLTPTMLECLTLLANVSCNQSVFNVLVAHLGQLLFQFYS